MLSWFVGGLTYGNLYSDIIMKTSYYYTRYYYITEKASSEGKYKAEIEQLNKTAAELSKSLKTFCTKW